MPTMPVSITLRDARSGDAEAIARFNAAMALETEHKRLDPASLRAGVAAVEDEAVRLNNRRRADVLAVGPERGAGGRAGGAKDTLGRIVKEETILL